MPSLQNSHDLQPSSAKPVVDPDMVRSALTVLLKSTPFHSSKQCRDLLSYIVEHSLMAEDGGLRERVIGAEVFGRAPDYNTSEDPVVRMRAADVRKRLAQFYQATRPDVSLPMIELQPGSYRASFRFEAAHVESKLEPALLPASAALAAGPAHVQVEKSPEDHTEVHSKDLIRILLVATAVVLLLLAGAGAYRWWSLRTVPDTARQRFWAPMLSTDKPVLIYLGSNVAYIFKSDFLERYQREHNLSDNGPEFIVDLPPNSILNSKDLQLVQNSFVTVGDVAATSQVVTLLNGLHQRFALRSAADVSFGDLRNTPTVLIGGFNNRWTLEVIKDLPFSLKKGTTILNRDHPQQSWSVGSTHASSAYDDYAVISRLMQSKTGAPLIIVSGIGQNGTQAAGEFLADGSQVEALLKQAPAGWQNKNMQIVLRVKVLDYLPATVDVVATAYW